jgi:hypothetical protein
MVMKFEPKTPPRRFNVGNSVKFDMLDCGEVRLQPDEQITFRTASGAEYDVAAKDWGFYATPSLNGRLEQFGLRGVLIRNRDTARYFMLLVESGKEVLFDTYCKQENLAVVAWLDSTAACEALRDKLDV